MVMCSLQGAIKKFWDCAFKKRKEQEFQGAWEGDYFDEDGGDI